MKIIQVNKINPDLVTEINGHYLLTFGTYEDTSVVKEDENDEKIYKAFRVEFEHNPSFIEIQNAIINTINEYDDSENVSSFIIDGDSAWLSKSTRLGLINSISLQQSNKETKTSIWINNKPYEFKISKALEFINNIEKYSIETFNITANKIKSVLDITNIDNFKTVDIISNYPTKLTINTKD